MAKSVITCCFLIFHPTSNPNYSGGGQKWTFLSFSQRISRRDRTCIITFSIISKETPCPEAGKTALYFCKSCTCRPLWQNDFEHPLSEQANAYIFGTDIRRLWKKKKLSLPNEVADRWSGRMRTDFALPTCSILSLKSTDEGAAFAIRETDGTSIYHAGDLNWWHWEGEPLAWNGTWK